MQACMPCPELTLSPQETRSESFSGFQQLLAAPGAKRIANVLYRRALSLRSLLLPKQHPIVKFLNTGIQTRSNIRKCRTVADARVCTQAIPFQARSVRKANHTMYFFPCGLLRILHRCHFALRHVPRQLAVLHISFRSASQVALLNLQVR